MITGFIIGIIIAVVYLLFYRSVIKMARLRLPLQLIRLLIAVHFIALAISLLSWWLYSTWRYVVISFWFPRLSVVLLLISGTFSYIFHPGPWSNRVVRCYFLFFSLFPFLLAGLLLIPLVGIVIIASLLGQLVSAGNILYSDNHILVRSISAGVLDDGETEVWLQKGFLYEKVAVEDYGYGQVQEVRVVRGPASDRIVFWGDYDGAVVPLDTISVPSRSRD